MLLLTGFKNNDNKKYDVKLLNVITQNEIEQFSARDSEIKLKLLYNLDDEPEYLLAYKENVKGYEIYNRISGALLEMSEEEENPYLGVDKGYFLSPMNYAKKVNNDIINIKDKHHYKNEEKKHFKNKQKELKEKNINEIADKAATSVSININNVVFDYTAIELEEYNNVAYPEIFYIWDNSLYFGDNTKGSCSAVSITLLYRYADFIYGGILPNLTPTSWASVANGYHVENVSNDTGENDYFDCTLSGMDRPTYVGQNLHNYLIALANVNSFGISDDKIQTMINAYNSEINSLGCINMLTPDRAVQSSVENVYNFVNNNITTDGMPSKISIFSKKEGDVESYHSSVAYGVKSNVVNDVNNYYFRIHNGYDYSNANRVINGDYLIISNNNYMYSFNVSTNNSHILTANTDGIHSCANTSCYANGVAHRYHNSNNTSHNCICGAVGSHSLETTKLEAMLPEKELHFCEECGFYEEHEWNNSLETAKHACIICNESFPHEWSTGAKIHGCNICLGIGNCTITSYSYYDDDGNVLSSQHKAYCSVCNNYSLEAHSEGACVSNGASGHSVSCSLCALELSSQAHTLTMTYYDANYHKNQCTECGWAVPLVKYSHNYEIYALFFLKCTGCGHVKMR